MEGLVKIATGEGTNGKPVRVADQIRAAELVPAYGWGKPPAVVSIEGHDSLEPDELTREIAATAAALLERRETRAN